MIITLIAAMSKNRVIGNKGSIPWHIPDELKRFREITMGHPLIMGRFTYNSLSKPLDGRMNIVLSHSNDFAFKNEAPVAASYCEALEIARSSQSDELFVCGGESVYRLFLPDADRVLLTEIDAEFAGDRFFPEIDDNLFKLSSSEKKQFKYPVTFYDYRRINHNAESQG